MQPQDGRRLNPLSPVQIQVTGSSVRTNTADGYYGVRELEEGERERESGVFERRKIPVSGGL